MPQEINKLYESLVTGLVHVIFKKATDDTVRMMTCTLNPEIVPPLKDTGTNKVRRSNPNVMAVYDIEKRGWRSFRLDSILDWHMHIKEEQNVNAS